MKPLFILVADDEADIRALISRWLERAGHHVTCAVNGVEALAVAEVKAFDLVVTDVLMPESDGVELIAKLKKIRPMARILAISGGGRVMEGSDCLRIAQGLGAHVAVMKPFTREQFMAAVDQALPQKPASPSLPSA